ncbi:MAG: hypothetical protein RI900_1660 [Actinomycetota bacterium]
MYDQDHQHTDDESNFWDHVPDSRLDGLRSAVRDRTRGLSAGRGSTHPAARRHHTDSIPVVRAHGNHGAAASDGVSRQPAIDPLLRRTGVLALVIALLVPVAMAMRGDDTGRANPLQPLGSPTEVSATGAVESPGAASPAEASQTATAESASAAGAAAPASVDIAALPEAVPVNTPAATVATAATASNEAPPATRASVPQAQSQSATASRATCSRRYTVAAGDAWVVIAKRHSVTTASLLAVNGATRRTMLYPGRTICLPSNASTPTTAKPVTTTTAKPAPAPTTTTKPAATVPPTPSRTYSRDEVIAIIREVWPDHLEDEAIRIAIRESNLKPAARNYCCIGLFQIYFNVHKRWLATIGVTSASQLTDPRVNAYAAVTLWNRAGSWAPWRL